MNNFLSTQLEANYKIGIREETILSSKLCLVISKVS